MPNRFQKAIRAFKDQTSISLAIVNGSSNIQVAVLKATSHDDLPIDEPYVQEILQLISSDKAFASACAKAIRRRITRTHNWVVALKSLMLVLRIFQDGDLYFPREVLHATKKGERLLNLSDFYDYSTWNPEDYTGFVKTFGLYLEERLDCILTGKLQRRYTYNERKGSKMSKKRTNDYIREMKPTMLIDRIIYWQRLLERAIAIRPTGVVQDNQLVKISVYAVVRESFDLYRDISDGLTYLLDNFLKLQYESCVSISDICVKAEKQFEELDEFYSACKTIGVGSALEYPTVQTLSRELVERLKEFLSDKTDLPEGGLLSKGNENFGEEPEFLKDKTVIADGGLLSRSNESYGEESELLKDKTVIPEGGLSSKDNESYEEESEDKAVLPESGLLSKGNESYGEESDLSLGKVSDKSSETSSECSLLEELTSAIQMGKSPSISIDLEEYIGEVEKRTQQEEPFVHLISFDNWPADNEKKENQLEKKEDLLESILDNELSDSSSTQYDPTSRNDWDFVLAEIVSPSSHTHSNSLGISANSLGESCEAFSKDEESSSWKLVLAHPPTHQQSTHTIDISPNTIHAFTAITLQNLQSKSQSQPTNHYNPFLQDLYDIPANNPCIASYWAQNQPKATNDQLTIKI